MRSRSYTFTSKVVPPTAEPVPPATWNRGNSHVLRSRRGPAAVPPRGIAYLRTQKHCQVYCNVRQLRGNPHVSLSPRRGTPERNCVGPHTEATSGVCRDMVIQSPWTCRCRIHQLRYFQNRKPASLAQRPSKLRSNRYHCQWQLSHHRVGQWIWHSRQAHPSHSAEYIQRLATP